MPKSLPTRCKDCQRRKSPRCHVSRRGLCDSCADQRHADAARQINAKRGPYYRKYLRGMTAWTDRAALDADAG